MSTSTIPHNKNSAEGYTYLPLIIEKLKTLHPQKVILFGSYAYGAPLLDDEFLTNIVAFHAQQAVEKSFKAIIEE